MKSTPCSESYLSQSEKHIQLRMVIENESCMSVVINNMPRLLLDQRGVVERIIDVQFM